MGVDSVSTHLLIKVISDKFKNIWLIFVRVTLMGTNDTVFKYSTNKMVNDRK